MSSTVWVILDGGLVEAVYAPVELANLHLEVVNYDNAFDPLDMEYTMEQQDRMMAELGDNRLVNLLEETSND